MKLRGDHCQCTVCKQFFNSTYAFDKHRTGDWLERRCLDVDQMKAKGMDTNRNGWWVSMGYKDRFLRGVRIQGKAIQDGSVG